jgi:transposase
MSADLFWFTDEQWSKIEPHLPKNQRGPARDDDRRILSGIMHVQKVGCRWKDCPREYGPHKTIYNRFARWSMRGIWQNIFAAVASPSQVPGQVALDSSHVKIHRCASGGKGGRRRRPLGSPKAAEIARFMRLSTRSVAHGCSSSRPATPPIV